MAKPTNKDFAKLSHSIFNRMAGLVQDLDNGTITADEWGDAFHALLVSGHSDAWTLGSKRGGLDTTELADFANQYGQQVADGEAEWLQNFINDLDSGRYHDEDGNLRISAVNARSRLYAAKMRGTANQAFVDTSDTQEQYEWRMRGTEHCNDCPRLAALSPYYASELFTVPGEGSTECISNCRCILVRLSDGATSFNNPF